VTWQSALRRAGESIWVRALITAALLGLVATQVDWSAAADRLSEGSWGWFAAAVVTLFASQLIAAWRWRILLDGAGLARPLLSVVRAYLIGALANNFLPTAFGGDLARAWLLARPGPPLVRALLSVLVDRFTAFWALIALAWITVPFDAGSVPASLVTALLALTVGGLAASGLILWFALRRGGGLAARLPGRLLDWAREARATLRLYGRRPKVLGLAALLGLAFQVLVVLAMWQVARAIDLQPSLSLLAVVAPLVLAITLVPISIAGFGVREGGMVLLLGAAGYGATEATLFSLMCVAALAVSSLPGAAAILAGSAFPSREELESAEAAALAEIDPA
jgi:uncharacterized protein (TIRG00374 family)